MTTSGIGSLFALEMMGSLVARLHYNQDVVCEKIFKLSVFILLHPQSSIV